MNDCPYLATVFPFRCPLGSKFKEVTTIVTRGGVSAGTLERWQAELLCGPALGRAQTAATRLDAVITTAEIGRAHV